MPTCLEALRLTEALIAGADPQAPSRISDTPAAPAAALGMALTGRRAAVFLSAEELAESRGLWDLAVERYLPLVVHVQGAPAAGLSMTGGLVLCAANAREAVDFALIARRVAELALLPGLVITDEEMGEGEPPSKDLVEAFLGSANAEIPTPTPAQRLLFGETRRRVPRWHDPDRPVLHGARRDGHSRALAEAGRQPFFETHLDGVLQAALARFGELTGRRYDALSTTDLKDAELVLVAQGGAVPVAERVAAELRGARRLKAGVLGIRCPQPFPEALLIESLRGKPYVAVLERTATYPPLVTRLRAGLERALENHRRGRQAQADYPMLREKDLPRIFPLAYGLDGRPPRPADLAAFCIALKEKHRPPDYLGLEFIRLATEYPKRRVLMDALRREYPHLLGRGSQAATVDAGLESGPAGGDQEPPLAVRRLRLSGDGYDSLPRFWDQIGVLYRDGRSHELTADPYLALAAVPPLASVFRDAGPERTLLPAFDPMRCSGCGHCWSVCPHSAIGVMVIGSQPLLEAGIERAGADSLRMIVPALATRMNKLGGQAPATAGALLRDAFAGLREALSEGRREALQTALTAVADALDGLPLARADWLQQGEKKGQHREWLSLVIDPDTCTSCGLCVAECAAGALTAASPSPERLAQAKALWRLWEQLPDTPGKTVERAVQEARIDPLAALSLSRHCAQALLGSDRAEPGSGARLALRWLVAVAEFQRQPQVHRLLDSLDKLRQETTRAIRDSLAQALPDQDLDALAEGLESLDSAAVELSELTRRVRNRGEKQPVDADRLRRLVASRQALEDLRWRLEQGPQGLGRARLSLALAPSVADWAARWPDNPFAVPVAAGVDPQLAAGLLAGHLHQAGKDSALLRRVRLELDKPRVAAVQAGDEPPMDWRELGPEEGALCPALLWIGDDSLADSQDLGAVLTLLRGELPVKIVVLADPDPAAGAAFDLGLTVLAQRRAWVAQTSLADPSHFYQSVRGMLEYPGPALLHIHAPSPKRRGIEPDRTLAEARRALAAGTFPLFRYDPRAAGVFGTRIDLTGNPAGPASADAPHGWRVLQELAGRVTPFTEGIEQAAQQRLATVHAAELAAQKARYEARIEALRQALEQDIAARIHGNLLALAGYGADAASKEAIE